VDAPYNVQFSGERREATSELLTTGPTLIGHLKKPPFRRTPRRPESGRKKHVQQSRHHPLTLWPTFIRINSLHNRGCM
jgi:hypothetical protein